MVRQGSLLLLLLLLHEVGNASNGGGSWLPFLDARPLQGARRSICGGGGDAVEAVEAGVVVVYSSWVLLTAGCVVASQSTELLWQLLLGLLILTLAVLVVLVLMVVLIALARGRLCVVVDETGIRLSYHRFR